MRGPVEINKESAISIAKWRIREEISRLKSKDIIQKMMLESSLGPGGGVEQIADLLYGMGVKLSIDRNDPTHAEWLRGGAVIEDKS